jgi:hypothetical protein
LRLVGTRHADAVPPAHDQIAKAKLVKRDRNLTGRRLLDRELVVAASKDLHKAMPATTTRALRSRLNPRIGPSRAFSRP